MRPTKQDLPSVPSTMADIALVDAATAAAPGGVSISWWHERVRIGEAPAPAVRLPRCTRWRLEDVRQFWKKFAEQPAGDASAQLMLETARRASAAAQRQRKVNSSSNAQ